MRKTAIAALLLLLAAPGCRRDAEERDEESRSSLDTGVHSDTEAEPGSNVTAETDVNASGPVGGAAGRGDIQDGGVGSGAATGGDARGGNMSGVVEGTGAQRGTRSGGGANLDAIPNSGGGSAMDTGNSGVAGSGSRAGTGGDTRDITGGVRGSFPLASGIVYRIERVTGSEVLLVPQTGSAPGDERVMQTGRELRLSLAELKGLVYKVDVQRGDPLPKVGDTVTIIPAAPDRMPQRAADIVRIETHEAR